MHTVTIRIFILGLLLAALAGPAGAQAPAPFLTGDQWLGMYEAGEAGRESAAAYVAGYVDGVQAAEATAGRKRFCVPDSVTEIELAAAVAAYLESKSVFRRMGAPFVIDNVLEDRFPC
jgi:hypothetical protein